jgi:predicted dienelactone hydrolase
MSDVDMCGPEPAFRAEAAKAGLTMEQLFGVMQEHLDKYGPTADPRVKAAFAMAPLSLIFDDHAFDNVTAPIYLYYAENDTVLRPDFNARHIQPLIHTLYAVKEVPKAEHWVFLTPCTPALAQDIRTMCSDPEGVDRAKVHATLNADALAFFRKTLHVPEH